MLGELNAVLGGVLTASDPHAAWVQACEDEAHSVEVRQLLRGLDPDALRLQALLVAKLRFERLVADSALAESFDADPEGFTERFRRYVQARAPSSSYPQAEVDAFRAWEQAEDARS